MVPRRATGDAEAALSTRARDRRFWFGLAAIALAGWAWRVGYVLAQAGRLTLNGDAAYYHWQGNDLAGGLWFVDPVQLRELGRETPSAFHPPAYPAFLGVVSALGGTTETWHRLASTLFGAIAVLALGALARRVFGSDIAGWVAAALAAGYAHLWINDEMLLSEGMYVAAVAVATLAAYRFWSDPGPGRAAALGAAIGVAALTRAEAVALVVLVALPLALRARPRSRSARWRLAAAAAVAAGVVVLPWVAFNLTRFERPVLLSNGLGSVLAVANCDHTSDTGEEVGTYDGPLVGYWQINCLADLDDRIAAHFTPERAAAVQADLGLVPGTDYEFYGDESTHEAAWRAVGLAEMRDHVRDLPRVVAFRVLRLWDLYDVEDGILFNGLVEGRGTWQSRLAAAQYFVLVLPALAGLVVARARGVPVLPFLAIAASTTLAAAITFGITRYRAPVDAMLPVLAGGAVAAVWERARVPHRPQP